MKNIFAFHDAGVFSGQARKGCDGTWSMVVEKRRKTENEDNVSRPNHATLLESFLNLRGVDSTYTSIVGETWAYRLRRTVDQALEGGLNSDSGS